MVDNFSSYSSALDSPARNAATITPHDTNDLANVTRGLYIGVAGALKVDMAGSGTITIAAAVAGYHPLCVSRVYSTGTDADDIHGLY